MDLFSFIDCANRARSVSALFDLLVDCAAKEGFGNIAYGALNYEESTRLPDHRAPAVAINFPQGWCEYYFERKYFDIDPVVRRTPLQTRPFLWDELASGTLLPGERTVLAESREAGLKRGVSVPLFGPAGRISVVSFASCFDDADPARHIGHLTALAWQFHVAFAEIARPADHAEQIALSERERDCLRWTAEGKSSWDIGKILSISDNTVNFHIKKAMRKLGTTSRTVAVVKAIRLNLIDIPVRQMGPASGWLDGSGPA